MALYYVFAPSDDHIEMFVCLDSSASCKIVFQILETWNLYIKRNLINLIDLQYKVLLNSSNFQYVTCKIFFIFQTTKSGLAYECFTLQRVKGMT